LFVMVSIVSNLEHVYSSLLKIKHLIVYKRDEIPSHLRIRNNVRVGDIMVVAKIGYTLWADSNSTYPLGE
jgi:hypothetical protein